MNIVKFFAKAFKFTGVRVKPPKTFQFNLFEEKQPSLFDQQPQEGQTKKFAEGDERKLQTTTTGKKRWVDADQEDLFSSSAKDKQMKPAVEDSKDQVKDHQGDEKRNGPGKSPQAQSNEPDQLKEPWQMTRDQYRANRMEEYREHPDTYDPKSVDEAIKELIENKNPQAKAIIEARWKGHFNLFDANHRQLINEAADAGKPVPEEVIGSHNGLSESISKRNEHRKRVPEAYTELSKPVKEPWEMTRNEFRNDRINKLEVLNTADVIAVKNNATGIWHIPGFPLITSASKTGLRKKAEEYRDEMLSNIEDGSLDDEHKSIIENAMKEGREISASVLKEYPELNRKTFSDQPEKSRSSQEQKPSEGETRQFGEKDKRRLETTPSGKKRWVDADQEDLFSNVKQENQDTGSGQKEEDGKKTQGKSASREKSEGLNTGEIPDEGNYDPVQRILDQRQANREYKDYNERVGGSKKEIATIKKLSASELLKQDSVTQYQTITKDKVLKEFDPAAHKELGESAGLVFFKMKLRQALISKPANSDAARKRYVEEMPELLEKLENAKNLNDLREIGSEYFDKYQTRKKHSYVSVFLYKEGMQDSINGKQEENDVLPEEVYGKAFLNLLFTDSDSAKDTMAEARKKNGYSREMQKKDYERHLELAENKKQSTIDAIRNLEGRQYFITLNSFYEKAESLGLIREINPGSHTYEKLDPELKAELQELSGLQPKKIENAYNKAIRKKLAKLDEAAFNSLMADAKKRKIEKLTVIEPTPFEKFAEKFPVREEDWSFLGTKNHSDTGDSSDTDDAGKAPKDKPDLQIHKNPKLDHIKRKNGRVVKDSDITLKGLSEEFGYSSVQLGHYVKDAEAKEHIRHYIGAMKDLEDVLGLDIKKINQTGNLSLAFGARGSGSAVAHYEPMRKIINITKTRGDGSIAHEWAHYFDHVLGGAKAGLEKNKGFITNTFQQWRHGKHDTPYEVVKAIANITRLINNNSTGDGIRRVIEPPSEKPGSYFRSIDSIYEGDRKWYSRKESAAITLDTPEKKYEAAIEFIDHSVKDKDKDIAYKQLAYILGRPIEVKEKLKSTRYYHEAKKLGEYWSRPHELFARAFEAYVEDKLAENGMGNNYLVAGNNVNGEEGKWSQESLGKAYPQGEERKALNNAFDHLIETVKSTMGLAKEPDSEPRVDESIDLKEVLKSFYSDENPSRGRFLIKAEKMNLDDRQKEGMKFRTYGTVNFQGMEIVVENKKGMVREGVDDDGSEWKTKMFYPYGYIKRTEGVDGDPVDVYLGDDRESGKVFIIHQMNPESGKYDEDKVMLGFNERNAARDAYLAHYDDQAFLGEITEMDIKEFRKKLKERKGRIIKSASHNRKNRFTFGKAISLDNVPGEVNLSVTGILKDLVAEKSKKDIKDPVEILREKIGADLYMDILNEMNNLLRMARLQAKVLKNDLDHINRINGVRNYPSNNEDCLIIRPEPEIFEEIMYRRLNNRKGSPVVIKVKLILSDFRNSKAVLKSARDLGYRIEDVKEHKQQGLNYITAKFYNSEHDKVTKSFLLIPEEENLNFVDFEFLPDDLEYRRNYITSFLKGTDRKMKAESFIKAAGYYNDFFYRVSTLSSEPISDERYRTPSPARDEIKTESSKTESESIVPNLLIREVKSSLYSIWQPILAKFSTSSADILSSLDTDSSAYLSVVDMIDPVINKNEVDPDDEMKAKLSELV